MRIRTYGSLALTLCLLSCQPTQKKKEIFSPDGTVKLEFSQLETGELTYSVFAFGAPLLENSKLGVEVKEYQKASCLGKMTESAFDETWTQPWGENKTIRNHYNELNVPLTNEAGDAMNIRFRVFDNGVGFRYEFDGKNVDSLTVLDEITEFNFAENGLSWSIPANFDTYELLYKKQCIDSIENANTPITFKLNSGIYASIHEAALTDFPEMTLNKGGELSFKSELAPLPSGIKARIPAKFNTPWRTIQIGDQAVDLINSGMILNLNEPCALENTDWIKPAKYVGVWWGMHLGIETWTMDERHGATTRNAKKYIDFAAKYNIPGVLFEGWNEGWESWGGRQNFDFTKPYADFDMDEITRYAKAKGVEIIGHHETGGNIPNYERQLTKSIEWYANYGVKMLKTGYAGGFPDGYTHHCQYGVRHYRKVVETAAAYKMMVNAHEPIKDTGIRRTWPNMMTREGARGMEWNAWSEGNPPAHHVTLPFTRLLAGPMDYTPGTFDILFENTRNLKTRKKWNDLDQGNSRVNTTLAKQLANWVILYSPLQMASDLIEHYEGHPAFQFFLDYDVDCDESRALAGEPGEFIVIMRKADDRYFLGASTNEEARSVSVALDFLEPGKSYQAVIYADGKEAHWVTNPTDYQIRRETVSSNDSLEIQMAAGGGQAISFFPL